MFNHSALSTWI